ncbi:hypothetical protein CLV24_105138 [Pontibacter ummariensis]|uniref:Uncharacterized protein n=1 Tax=Pontibacter ummariensis TaxID=1610492 RepID=A0A239DTC6_9BACT|nr:hypothetical protein [Pontibacter ummariensis]PRY13768.1 hypothetical protein CLV24_105138 [Pontibacter ummariensis]SNS35597.1 hypothetical protein SAMN06296052_105114 [Pontibacter ummariensis]
MSENEEGEKAEVTTPADEQQTSIPSPRGCPLYLPFDAAPLLEVLMDDDGPLGVAEALDKAYTTLAEYMVSDPNTAGDQYAHILYELRRLRNALLKGKGWHQL